MTLEEVIVEAISKVAIAGGIGGLIGGLFGSTRASLFGSLLMGVIGGIVAATILRILNIDPIIAAGQGFSYVYGFGGGLVLAFIVSVSNRK